MGGERVVLGVIAGGGALGALARYGVAVAVPQGAGGFAWGTFLTNVGGCLLMGVLMGVITTRSARPLVRPFLGVGFLGGFTTFSAYVVDVQRQEPGAALLYLVATPAAAFAAVWVGHRLAAR